MVRMVPFCLAVRNVPRASRKGQENSVEMLRAGRGNAVEDLSHYHHPVGKLFTRPTAEEEWEKYRLSAEQVEFFRENGYLAGVRIFTDEQVEALRGELERLMDPGMQGANYFTNIIRMNRRIRSGWCFTRWGRGA